MTVRLGTRPAVARWTAHLARSTLNRSSASSGFSASNLRPRRVSQSSVGSLVAKVSSSGGGAACSMPMIEARRRRAASRRLLACSTSSCALSASTWLCRTDGLRAFERFEPQFGGLQRLRADLLQLVGKRDRALGGEQLVVVHADGGDDLLPRAFEPLFGGGDFAEGNGAAEAELAGRDEFLADEAALHARAAFVADFVADVADLRIGPQADLQPFAAGGADQAFRLAHRGMIGQGHRLGFGKRQQLVTRHAVDRRQRHRLGRNSREANGWAGVEHSDASRPRGPRHSTAHNNGAAATATDGSRTHQRQGPARTAGRTKSAKR